ARLLPRLHPLGRAAAGGHAARGDRRACRGGGDRRLVARRSRGARMSPPLADAHLHLFSRGFPGRTGRPVLGRDPEIEAYEAFRAAHGIAAGLVVGYEADGIDPDNNRYIRALAAERPWLATLAYVEAAPAPSAESASALLQDGHAGLAVYLRDAAAAEA